MILEAPIPEINSGSIGHLIVICHGLWGSASHLVAIKNAIENSFKDKVYVINVDSFPGVLTYDGIDICGDKVIEKIQPILVKKPKTISFIGYSLGGLILRYAIGKLYLDGVFETVKPLFYISFASPHLGTRKPQSLAGKMFNAAQSIYLVRVGAQFSIRDKEPNLKRPLLIVMTDPEQCFMKGLKLFSLCVCFANTQNDRSVNFTSSSISLTNPYNRFKKIVIDKDYPSVVSFENDSNLLKNCEVKPAYLAILPLMPVVFTILLSVLTFTAVRARLRLGQLKPDHTRFVQVKEDKEDDHNNLFEHHSVKGYRAYMIHHLNEISWRKIDVSINALNAHAAIVQRGNQPSEGDDVIRYLVKHVLEGLLT